MNSSILIAKSFWSEAIFKGCSGAQYGQAVDEAMR